MFNTRESLEREIARITALLDRPNYLYPNLTRMRIVALKRYRMRFTWPLIFRARQAIAAWLYRLAISIEVIHDRDD